MPANLICRVGFEPKITNLDNRDTMFWAELPDGIFAYQKSQIGYILEALGMDNVGIFYEHYSKYCTDIL
jgi:hypothetical protein